MFPAPQLWATWIGYRTEKFKTHPSLAMCKSAISAKFNGGVLPCSAYVYEWDTEQEVWVERFFLGAGVDKSHIFFKVKAKKIKGPSQKQVDAALASIAKSAWTIEDDEAEEELAREVWGTS